MNRRIKIDKQWVEFTQADLLGIGGEAEVYRHGQLAVKLFHDLAAMKQFNPGISTAQLEQRQAEKAAKLRAFPRQLPSNVVSPLSLVTSRKGVLGYTMPLLHNAFDLRMLAKRSFRQGVIGNAEVGDLFVALQKTLDALHRQHIIVGDLNDSNVLFKERQVYFIDADSMQFGPYACPVGTEQFLDPRLYGKDLTRQPLFTPQSDYFSAAALLLSSWLYVGPYGGRHPQLRSWLRRADQRVSIFSSTVMYPKAAVRYDILPDEMLEYFVNTFEKDVRHPLPVNMIESLAWTRCQCGLEHARAHCPCQQLSGPVKETTVIHQSVKVTKIFKTRGQILACAVDGGELRYLYEENQVLYRENGDVVTRGKRLPGMRFALSGRATWIGQGEQLIKVDSGEAVERKTTSCYANLPVFAVIGQRLLTINASYLRLDDRIVGRVMPGQTWFSGGAEFGFGFYQAGLLRIFFIIDPKQAHLLTVNMPAINGRIRDIQCNFSEQSVLATMSVESNGVVVNHAYLVRRADGEIIGQLQASPDQSGLLAQLGSKLVNGTAIVSAGDDGLMLFRANGGRIEEVSLFKDSELFIRPGATLAPAPDGSLYQISAQAIERISLLDKVSK